MKIKEASRIVDISSANIRYYEKEGLLNPKRNDENNYREYTEDDVARLENIKKLRLLGISVHHIKKIYSQEITLQEVLQLRLQELDEAKRNLELTKEVCQKAIQQQMDMEHLSELEIDEKNETWQRRLAVIMLEDTVQEIITQKQFHFHIAIMLSWGYILCAVVSLILQNTILQYGLEYQEHYEKAYGFIYLPKLPGILIGMGIVAVGSSMVFVWTSRMMFQLIAFHLSGIAQSTFLMLAFSANAALGNVNQYICKGLPLLWGLMMLFVLLIYGIYCLRPRFFEKARYMLISCVGFLLLAILILGLINGFHWRNMILVGMLAFASLSVGLQWFHATNDVNGYNRFYAVSVSGNMYNLIGFLFAGHGYYGGANIFRR